MCLSLSMNRHRPKRTNKDHLGFIQCSKVHLIGRLTPCARIHPCINSSCGVCLCLILQILLHEKDDVTMMLERGTAVSPGLISFVSVETTQVCHAYRCSRLLCRSKTTAYRPLIYLPLEAEGNRGAVTEQESDCQMQSEGEGQDIDQHCFYVVGNVLTLKMS